MSWRRSSHIFEKLRFTSQPVFGAVNWNQHENTAVRVAENPPQSTVESHRRQCPGVKMASRSGMQLMVIFSLISIGFAQTSPITTLFSWINTFQGGGSAVARRLLLEYFRVRAVDDDILREEFIPTIIGGYPVESRRELPFMARLSLCSSGSNCYHICGAVIVSKRYLLSAGHCMFYPSTRDVLQGVQATMGDLQIYVLEPDEVQMAVKLIPHPNYDNLNFYRYDVGLALLQNELVLGPRIAALNLPSTILDITHKTGQIPGWGRYDGTPGTKRVASNLQLVDLLVLSLEECKQTYTDKVTEAHVCYGGFNSTGGICNGDSGGPVYIFLSDADDVGTVIAVNSFIRRTATDDCPTEKPGVGTRISYYLDFINSVIGGSPSDPSNGNQGSGTQNPNNEDNSLNRPNSNPNSPSNSDSNNANQPNSEQGGSAKLLRFLEDFLIEARMWLLPDQYGFRGRYVRNDFMFDD